MPRRGRRRYGMPGDMPGPYRSYQDPQGEYDPSRQYDDDDDRQYDDQGRNLEYNPSVPYQDDEDMRRHQEDQRRQGRERRMYPEQPESHYWRRRWNPIRWNPYPFQPFPYFPIYDKYGDDEDQQRGQYDQTYGHIQNFMNQGGKGRYQDKDAFLKFLSKLYNCLDEFFEEHKINPDEYMD